jgi:hypothetical protein
MEGCIWEYVLSVPRWVWGRVWLLRWAEVLSLLRIADTQLLSCQLALLCLIFSCHKGMELVFWMHWLGLRNEKAYNYTYSMISIPSKFWNEVLLVIRFSTITSSWSTCLKNTVRSPSVQRAPVAAR